MALPVLAIVGAAIEPTKTSLPLISLGWQRSHIVCNIHWTFPPISIRPSRQLTLTACGEGRTLPQSASNVKESHAGRDSDLGARGGDVRGWSWGQRNRCARFAPRTGEGANGRGKLVRARDLYGWLRDGSFRLRSWLTNSSGNRNRV